MIQSEPCLAEATAPFDAILDRVGMLAAAARLDALGAEVLAAVEAQGLGEADVRLVYGIGIARSGRAPKDHVAFAALVPLLREGGHAIPRAAGLACRALRPRDLPMRRRERVRP